LTIIAPAVRAQEDVPEAAQPDGDAKRAREANRIDDASAKYRRVIEAAPSRASATSTSVRAT
jgi:hypothetical protein